MQLHNTLKIFCLLVLDGNSRTFSFIVMSVAFLRPFKRSNFTKKDQCIKYISTSFVISHTNVGFHFFISDLVIYKALLSGIYDLPELIMF